MGCSVSGYREHLKIFVDVYYINNALITLSTYVETAAIEKHLYYLRSPNFRKTCVKT